MVIYRVDVSFQSVKILMDMFNKYQFSIFCFLTFVVSALEEEKQFCKAKLYQNAINSPA